MFHLNHFVIWLGAVRGTTLRFTSGHGLAAGSEESSEVTIPEWPHSKLVNIVIHPDLSIEFPLPYLQYIYIYQDCSAPKSSICRMGVE